PAGRVLRSGAVIGSPANLVEPGSHGVATRAPGDLREATRPGAPEAGPEGGLFGGGIGAGRAADRRLRRTLPPDTEWPVRQGVPGWLSRSSTPGWMRPTRTWLAACCRVPTCKQGPAATAGPTPTVMAPEWRA